MDHMIAYRQMVSNPNVKKFVLTMRDKEGKEHRIHMTGGRDADETQSMAIRGFCNYTFVRIEEVDRPPLRENPVPVEAFSHGIKEEIQRQRLR